jgi:hypothetical protein
MAAKGPYAVERYDRPGQYPDMPEYGNRQPHQTYDQDGYDPYDLAAYRDELQMQSPEHPTLPQVTHTNQLLNGSGEK